jgi:hypothetical protein
LEWSGRDGRAISQCGIAARDQCEELPSSLELVEKKIDAKKTITISGTTKKGEVMSMGTAP